MAVRTMSGQSVGDNASETLILLDIGGRIRPHVAGEIVLMARLATRATVSTSMPEQLVSRPHGRMSRSGWVNNRELPTQDGRGTA